MAGGNTQDVLRLLERTAVEHLAWLTRVHCTLMFPGQSPRPAPPETPLDELCTSPDCPASSRLLLPMATARRAMYDHAGELMGHAEAGGFMTPERYGRFMAAVDAYAREARRVETQLRRTQAETDPLTGVRNRLGMMRELRREWTRAARTGRPCCVAVADLDFFKRVNDTHGHGAGDRVLCQVAAFFARRLRPYDLVFRFGGEEFLFCLPDTDLDSARRVLNRLCGLMARVPVVLEDGTRLPVTCSIGVAAMRPHQTLHDTNAEADRALYRAKNAGRNRVEAEAHPRSAARPVAERMAAGE